MEEVQGRDITCGSCGQKRSKADFAKRQLRYFKDRPRCRSCTDSPQSGQEKPERKNAPTDAKDNFKNTKLLSDLPATVLALLWPPERAVMGTHVSHFMRRDVMPLVLDALLAQCPQCSSPVTQNAVVKTVCRQLAPIALRCSNGTGKVVMNAVVEAARIAIVEDREEPAVSQLILRRREWKNDKEEIRFITEGEKASSIVHRVAPLVNLLRSGTASVLTLIDLGSHGIGDAGARALADALGGCPQLQRVCLNNNSLGGEGTRALFRTLSKCVQLQHLDISGNAMGEGTATMLADFDNCSMLSLLALRGCMVGPAGMAVFAKSKIVSRWPQLTDLDLSHNAILDAGAKELAAVLADCGALRQLALSHNKIGDTGWQRLAGALGQAESLEALVLDEEEPGAVQCVAGVLMEVPGLRRLELGRVLMRRPGAFQALETLCRVLGRREALTELRLGDAAGSDEGMGAVAGVLGRRGGELRSLDLSSASSLQEVKGVGVHRLAEALRGCSRLERLRLTRTSVGEDGAAELLRAIAGCPRLRALDLGATLAMANPASALAEGLGACSGLTALEVRGNALGAGGYSFWRDANQDRAEQRRGAEQRAAARGWGELREALVEGPGATLRRLDVGDNSLREGKLAELAEALGQCSALEHLSVADNLGELSAGFWEQLGRCGRLAYLNASGNRMLPGALREAAPGLAGLSRLSQLLLVSVDLQSEGAEALAEALRASTAPLEVLNLASNGVHACGMGRLVAALAACKAASLSALDMSNNRLNSATGGAPQDPGRAPFVAVAAALAGLPALAQLELRMCGLDAQCAEALAEVLRGGDLEAVAVLDARLNPMGGDAPGLLNESVRAGTLLLL